MLTKAEKRKKEILEDFESKEFLLLLEKNDQLTVSL
jgi:hypothetical protein